MSLMRHDISLPLPSQDVSSDARSAAPLDPLAMPYSAERITHPLLGAGVRIRTPEAQLRTFSVDGLVLWLHAQAGKPESSGVLGMRTLETQAEYERFAALGDRYGELTGEEIPVEPEHINHYRLNGFKHCGNGFTLAVNTRVEEACYMKGSPLNKAIPKWKANLGTGAVFTSGFGSGFVVGSLLVGPLGVFLGTVAGITTGLISGASSMAGVLSVVNRSEERKYSRDTLLAAAVAANDEFLKTRRTIAVKRDALIAGSAALAERVKLANALYLVHDPTHTINVNYACDDPQRLEESFAYLLGKRAHLPGVEPKPVEPEYGDFSSRSAVDISVPAGSVLELPPIRHRNS